MVTEVKLSTLQLWAGREQVPVDLRLVCSTENEVDDPFFIVMATNGPPFGGTPSIRPFTMKDGDLYAASLREILQEEVDNPGIGEGTKDALHIYACTARLMADFLEEFAAKFPQKAIELEDRAREGNVGNPTEQT